MKIEVDADDADLFPSFFTLPHTCIPVFQISTMLLSLTLSFHNREAKGKAGGMDQD